jgi:hypothetical protein
LTLQAGPERQSINLLDRAQSQSVWLDHVKFLLLAAVDLVHFPGQPQAAQTAVVVRVVIFIQHRHFYRLAHKPSQ